ncbi:acyl-CoA dehydrogenase [Actinomadura sp. ATCC 31491]|uniref:Acyl-CoA dehydrogenase n=1 Tax=Actinomadura luzonensis TaxID=2805427 RepID=A0ABT0G379_9ACTN|nr:acyl-CoA dehydrogenase [Actinomadura luzonensis]MCK2218640.1 acyl-CoA dehydrogenase [Actinomadura luzonensis]
MTGATGLSGATGVSDASVMTGPAGACGFPPAFPAAEELERALGDPHGPTGPLTFATAMEGDRAERWPHSSLDRLRSWGYPAHLVPASLGGRLTSLEELLALGRVVARRDPTAAVIANSPWASGTPVWLAGTPAQRRDYADAVLRGQWMSLALTEYDRGADLLGGELTARRVAGGYLLDGAKWVINNVRLARFVCLLVREPALTGLRSLTLLLVDMERLPAGSYELLPRIHTHGIRGADISGVRFLDAFVPDSAVLGRPGRGLDLTIRSLITIRTLVPGLSLGAFDTGLRCAFDVLRHRRVQRRRASDLPDVRHELAAADLDLRVAETVATCCVRLLHHLPALAPVSSAVAKYLVPHLAEQRLRRLAGTLGARYLLTRDHWHGVYEKLVRDTRLFSLFDGSEPVVLSSLAAQVSCLTEPGADPRAADPVFRPVFAPRPYPEGLAALGTASDLDPVIAGLGDACAGLERRDGGARAAALLRAAGRDLLADARRDVDPRSEAGQQVGERYARTFAAVCVARSAPAHWAAAGVESVLRPGGRLPVSTAESLFLDLALRYAGRSALALTRTA